MKIKTLELTGAQLDWAVAKCLKLRVTIGHNPATTGPGVYDETLAELGCDGDLRFNPSTDWAQGGPIIEREKLQISTERDGGWISSAPYAVEMGGYRKYIFTYGPTPLISAMRCYVASKLGDEIEIPDELKA